MNAEVSELLLSRKSYVEENYPKVRAIYRSSYNWPELDPIRHEICIALTLGLHQASITLTNHLMESVLKYGLIYNEYFKLPEQTEEEIRRQEISSLEERFSELFKRIGKINLRVSIDMACSADLIDKKQKKKLHYCRKRFRNAFSHSDKAKTFGQATIPAQSIHFSEQEGFQFGEKATPHLSTLIMFQGIAQAEIAKQDATPYFKYIDYIVRQIQLKLFGESDENALGQA